MSRAVDRRPTRALAFAARAGALTFALAAAIAACGGPGGSAGRAVPAEVEVEWPDAAPAYERGIPGPADAGTDAGPGDAG